MQNKGKHESKPIRKNGKGMRKWRDKSFNGGNAHAGSSLTCSNAGDFDLITAEEIEERTPSMLCLGEDCFVATVADAAPTVLAPFSCSAVSAWLSFSAFLSFWRTSNEGKVESLSSWSGVNGDETKTVLSFSSLSADSCGSAALLPVLSWYSEVMRDLSSSNLRFSWRDIWTKGLG